MGDVIPFRRIQSASEGLQTALREFHEAVEELKALCDEQDRQMADKPVLTSLSYDQWRKLNGWDDYPPA